MVFFGLSGLATWISWTTCYGMLIPLAPQDFRTVCAPPEFQVGNSKLPCQSGERYRIPTALLGRPEVCQDRNVMLEMNELNNKLPSMRISYSSRCLFNSNLRRRKRVGSGIAKMQSYWNLKCVDDSWSILCRDWIICDVSFASAGRRRRSMIIFFSSPIYWKIPTLKTEYVTKVEERTSVVSSWSLGNGIKNFKVWPFSMDS